MNYNKLAGNKNLNGISNFVLAGNEFQGRLTGWAAPEKGFPGAVGAMTRPWKLIFRGGPYTRPWKT